MDITKGLVEKFKAGLIPLTDKEVVTLHKFYSDLENGLRLLGERYHHSWRAVRDDREVLSSWLSARARDKHCKENNK